VTVHPHPTWTEYGWALATCPLVMISARGTLICGSRLVFLSYSSFRVDLLDGLFPAFPSVFSLLDETRGRYKDARRCLTFYPTTTLQRTCMHTTHLLVSLGPLPPGPRCNFYCLISSHFPFLSPSCVLLNPG